MMGEIRDGAEQALGRHPWHVLFFTLLGINVYAITLLTLASFFIPDLAERFENLSAEDVSLLWLFQVVFAAALFVHASTWSEKIGAGPFAGRLDVSLKWLILAIIMGPIISLILQNLVFYLLMHADSEAAYTSEATRLMMAPESVGPMMLMSVLVLAPLVEEVIYRGIGTGYLLARGLPWPLVVTLMSVAFSLQHGQYTLPALLSVFLLGLFLGWLRVKSGSIAPAIFAHMAINTHVVIAISSSSG